MTLCEKTPLRAAVLDATTAPDAWEATSVTASRESARIELRWNLSRSICSSIGSGLRFSKP